MPICVGRDLKGMRRRFCRVRAILEAEGANNSEGVFLVLSAMICRQAGGSDVQLEEIRVDVKQPGCCNGLQPE